MFRTYRPNLMLLHIDDTDAAEHNYGPESPEAVAAIEEADGRVQQIVDAVAAAGLQGRTDIDYSAGGAGFVMLRNPDDAALRDRVWALLQKLAADPANGILHLWTRDDLAKVGADPRAWFAIDMRNGFYSGGGHATLLSKPSGKGGQGFSPARPELHALVMSGPGVPNAGSVGIVRMTQIGPTIASWFKARLSPQADQPIAWPARSTPR